MSAPNSIKPEPTTKPAGLLITGGRDYNDKDILFRECDRIFNMINSGGYSVTYISGERDGAQIMSQLWAVQRNIPVEIIDTPWLDVGTTKPKIIMSNKLGVEYNSLAGGIANDDMVSKADYMLAFWDGHKDPRSSLVYDAIIKFRARFPDSHHQRLRIIKYHPVGGKHMVENPHQDIV